VAGLAAAQRITADPTQSVLVIEAGADYGVFDPEIMDFGDALNDYATITNRIPNKYFYQIYGQTEPGLNGDSITFNSGRAVGGNSAVGDMYVTRGDDEFWDTFDASVGSPGTFTAAEMNAVYESFEWLNDYGVYATTATRGTGQLPGQTFKVDVSPSVKNLTGFDQELFVNFMSQTLGIPGYFNESYNNPGYSLGSFAYTEYMWNFNSSSPRTRWSGRLAFLGDLVMNQQTYTGVPPRQLKVLPNSTVLNISSRFVNYRGIDGITRNAYIKNGGNIILTAGQHSPALLQRFGVGPAAVLERAGITPVAINEFVGAKTVIEPTVLLISYLPGVTGIPPADPVFNINLAYAEDVSSIGVPGTRGYVYFTVAIQADLMLNAITFLKPLSSGSYNVSSPDPLMEAQIVTNTLTNSDDRMSMRDNIRNFIANAAITNPSYMPINLDAPTLADDTLLDQWIRDNFVTRNAYFETCRMGQVVDTRFRVIGAPHIRVCDSTVMNKPSQGISAYSSAALGDICGRMILEDAGLLNPAKKKRVTLPRKTQTRKRKSKILKKTATFQKRLADSEMWALYQRTIEAIRNMFSNRIGVQVVESIKLSSEYQRLLLIYGGIP